MGATPGPGAGGAGSRAPIPAGGSSRAIFSFLCQEQCSTSTPLTPTPAPTGQVPGWHRAPAKRDLPQSAHQPRAGLPDPELLFPGSHICSATKITCWKPAAMAETARSEPCRWPASKCGRSGSKRQCHTVSVCLQCERGPGAALGTAGLPLHFSRPPGRLRVRDQTGTVCKRGVPYLSVFYWKNFSTVKIHIWLRSWQNAFIQRDNCVGKRRR